MLYTSYGFLKTAGCCLFVMFNILGGNGCQSTVQCFRTGKVQSILPVPDSKSRNIPEVVFVRRWAVGVLGIWKGWDSWVKGGANGVSLQAT